MTEISIVDRSQALLDELAAARADAVRWEFDLPSDAAYAQAETLLRAISASTVPTETLEVAVGVDGVVEITLSLGETYFVVDVEPDGTRIQFLARPLRDRAPATFVAKDLASAEILQILRKAAAA